MNQQIESAERCLALSVSGDLISTNVAALRAAANSLVSASGPPSDWNVFKLDLRSASMIDSAGLNFVVTLLKQVRSRGARLQICYSNPNLKRTFTFTRLDQHVDLVMV